METFTLHDMLINSTDIYKILCGLGLKNDSDCFDGSDLQPDPKATNQTVRIVLYSVIFLLSVLGNTLIITVLVRNRRMRTVTNLFLLSLAASDLMLCIFCMPFTLIPNLMSDFIFGRGMCKVATYFMGISVSVSTFNLVAISLERYSAICKPLSSRTWQTKSHAAKVIFSTWIVSFLLMLPYPIFSTVVAPNHNINSTTNMCRPIWPSDVVQQAWYVLLLLLLFLVPGVIMMTAYGLISLELYRGIKFESMNKKNNREQHSNTGSLKSGDGDGCYLQPATQQQRQLEPKQAKQPCVHGTTQPQCSAVQLSKKPKLSRVSSSSSAANLMAKKRVIRMLIVIVSLFFLCWMPVFTVNAWRAFHQRSANQLLSGAPISFIHLLSYTSACVNPIIYCFMNKRFRLGVLATFGCCERQPPGQLSRGPATVRDTDENGTLTRLTYSSIRSSAQT